MDTKVPKITVVTGPSGSEKTTLAQELQTNWVVQPYLATRSNRDISSRKIKDLFFDIVNTYLTYRVRILIRVKFHEEKEKITLGNNAVPQRYNPPVLDVPILRVNTTEDYEPAWRLFCSLLRRIVNHKNCSKVPTH
jgi:hypothetical protein